MHATNIRIVNPVEEHPSEPFIGRLRSAVTAAEVAVLSVVPVLLVGVFALPVGTRETLVFAYAEPTLRTAFAANFVHLEMGHLLTNLVGYGLVVPVVYLLSVLSGHRKRFWVAFATFLLAFPVALSYLNLAVARPGGTVGFSGITMAFVGLLPIALSGYLDMHLDIDGELDLASGLHFVGLALIAVLSLRSMPAYGIAVAALLAAVLCWSSLLDGDASVRSSLRAAARAPGYLELAAVGVVLFVGLPVAAFPVDAVADGVLNLYAHLFGYALGFIATYATVQIARRPGPGVATTGPFSSPLSKDRP